jgi:hypothetical protein
MYFMLSALRLSYSYSIVQYSSLYNIAGHVCFIWHKQPTNRRVESKRRTVNEVNYRFNK